jgi:hypothetical protein
MAKIGVASTPICHNGVAGLPLNFSLYLFIYYFFMIFYSYYFVFFVFFLASSIFDSVGLLTPSIPIKQEHSLRGSAG